MRVSWSSCGNSYCRFIERHLGHWCRLAPPFGLCAIISDFADRGFTQPIHSPRPHSDSHSSSIELLRVHHTLSQHRRSGTMTSPRSGTCYYGLAASQLLTLVSYCVITAGAGAVSWMRFLAVACAAPLHGPTTPYECSHAPDACKRSTAVGTRYRC